MTVPTMVRQLCSRGKGFSTESTEKEAGRGGKREKHGIRSALGRYIAFVDCDDWLKRERIVRLRMCLPRRRRIFSYLILLKFFLMDLEKISVTGTRRYSDTTNCRVQTFVIVLLDCTRCLLLRGTRSFEGVCGCTPLPRVDLSRILTGQCDSFSTRSRCSIFLWVCMRITNLPPALPLKEGRTLSRITSGFSKIGQDSRAMRRRRLWCDDSLRPSCLSFLESSGKLNRR